MLLVSRKKTPNVEKRKVKPVRMKKNGRSIIGKRRIDKSGIPTTMK